MQNKVLKRHFNASRSNREYKKTLWLYDTWGKLTERKAGEAVLAFADVHNGSDVLDVACGTGEMLKKLAQRNPDGRNVGVDLSPDMLAKAEKKLRSPGATHAGSPLYYTLIQANAHDLPFADGAFDVLVNSYMADMLPEADFDDLAAEFYRVLRPGGVLAMSSFSFGTKAVHRFWYLLAKWFPAVLTRCRPIRFAPYLTRAGFVLEAQVQVSQNTFPSEVLKVRKPSEDTV